MENSGSDLWGSKGTLDRGPYAVLGAVLFALKHNVDRFVASAFFARPWSPFNYVQIPGENVQIHALKRDDILFFGTLAAIALPFVVLGVWLTVRRLRAAGLPLWLVALFFVPVL